MFVSTNRMGRARPRGRLGLLGRWMVLVLLATTCGGGIVHRHPEARVAPTDPVGSQGTDPEPIQVENTPPPLDSPTTFVRFDRYSLEQGLSQSSALCILQDSRGFLWIGTEDGLNRFDGYSFRIYRHDPEEPYGLSNSHISSLYEDPSGALWVGTYGGGLNRLDRETGQFTHYRHNAQDANSLSEDQVMAVTGDRDGVLWVGTRGGGLNRLDPAQERWQHYRADFDTPYSLSDDRITSILEDSSGVLWVGTANGLNQLDRETDRWQRYQWDPDNPRSLYGNTIQSICEDRSGDLWIGTAGGGLNNFDHGTGTFVHYGHVPADPHSLSSDSVTAVLEDPFGVLWVGTEGGLDRFDREKEQFIHYRSVPGDPHSLSDNQVNSLGLDLSGGLWVGTRGGGLNRYDRQREQFALYRADPNDANSLSNNTVWGIYEEDSGVLWIGTDGGGLNRLDRQAGRWHHYRNDPADPYSLGHDVVVAVYRDRSGVLWLGTWGGGLARFDQETEQFTHYRYDPNDPRSLSSNIVWFILEDQLGALWIGTAYGLNRFDRDTQQFTRYHHDPEDLFSLSDNNVGSVLEDRKGVLWFGTHRGLNRFDRDTGRFARYQHDPEDPQSLSHNIVFSIYEDQAGTMWLGTWGGGLNRFDRIAETFTHYRVRDGLPNDVVYGILEDEQGHLWLSTNNGISRFDPQTGAFRNYDVGDGLQSAEFNYNSYFKGPRGEMYFGGINGFNAFYPDAVRDNAFVPPVVLTSMTQGGEAVDLGKAVEALTQISFKWPNNDFEFEFAVLSFYQPEKNQYAYMLEGYDDDWHYVGTRRFGAYTNLPGGTYTLRLKGSNNDGVWNTEGLSTGLTIVPPFWSTWWFRALLVVAVAAAAVAAVRLRLRSIEERGRELEYQVADRTRELAALNAVAAAASRSLNLQQILSDALEKTLEVTDLEAGGIYLLQEKTPHSGVGVLNVAAHKGLSAEFVAGVDNLVVGEGFSGRVAQTGEPLVVQDLAADPRLTRSVVTESGYRSVAIVPVVSRAKTLGTLFVVSRGYHEFLQSDVELLVSIGSQIGVAIENARFFEAEQHRAEQFRVIAKVGHQITSILDIDEVLEQVVSLVQQAFDYYHVAIGLIEEGEVVYRVGAGRLWEGKAFHGQPGRLKIGGEGLSGWVAATGEPLLVPDVSQEPRYVWMRPSETRSELVLPIMVKGQVVGVLDVQSEHLNAFDNTDLAVLQSLAHQTGTAIENARLYEQAQQTAVVEERSRLARELHDAVTQTLFSASLIAEALPSTWETDLGEGQQLLKELQQLTRGALAEMRTLLLELRPMALVETSLIDLLRQLGDAAIGRMGVPVEVTVEGACVLPPEAQVTLYRIAQEAMNNVAKHARASQVVVSLRCTPVTPGPRDVSEGEEEDSPSREGGARQRVELCIRDDGRGFEPGEVTPDHFGLGIMRERAAAIGAELTVDSEPGMGTQVMAVWEGNEGRITKDE
jgi:ligand-binding sensor domain-containing protein/signal transduction histidine kinase